MGHKRKLYLKLYNESVDTQIYSHGRFIAVTLGTITLIWQVKGKLWILRIQQEGPNSFSWKLGHTHELYLTLCNGSVDTQIYSHGRFIAPKLWTIIPDLAIKR